MLKRSFVSGFISNKNTDSNYSFGVYAELNNFGSITLKECAEIHEKLKTKVLKVTEGEYLKEFKIDLSDYYRYEENGQPIVSSEEYPEGRKGKDKTAKYFIKSNTLRIYENGMPIYENANGIICNDAAALCDCLC